jgi:DNA repair protein RadC
MVIKNKVRGLPGVDQPREKLLNSGVGSLADKDILALLLRSGVKNKNVVELAEEILKKYTLEGLSRVELEELLSIGGLGLTRASALMAAFELNRRLEKEKKNMRPKLDTPEKVYGYVSDIHSASREKFIAVFLDIRMRVIKRAHISVGTVSASIVHPRDVFRPAIENNASNIILVHNHPSGDEMPSEEDITITRNLIEAGRIMGINIVDHMIVTENNYYSFKENSLI